MQTQMRVETRNDDIDVALHWRVKRNPFFSINKVAARESSFGGYRQQQVFFTD
jgi:hypothetical protein